MKSFANPDVERIFDSYPATVRRAMLALRELIFETASSIDGVGEIEETLKWGEPAYLTSQSRSGTTVRIAWKVKWPDQYAMYFHCQTNLIDTFRTLFADDFQFEGNRAIVFKVGSRPSRDALVHCVAAALTYHTRKHAQTGDKRSTHRPTSARR